MVEGRGEAEGEAELEADGEGGLPLSPMHHHSAHRGTGPGTWVVCVRVHVRWFCVFCVVLCAWADFARINALQKYIEQSTHSSWCPPDRAIQKNPRKRP
jgi:hypothetical protein